MRTKVLGQKAMLLECCQRNTAEPKHRRVCVRYMHPRGVGYPWTFGRNGEEIDVEVEAQSHSTTLS